MMRRSRAVARCATINANGGGSLFNDGGTVTLNDVAFNGELTSSNPLGGAISNAFGNLTMTDVSFTNEQAAAGGALFVRGGNVSGVGVTFENNGNGSFDGGAAYVLGGTCRLTNATIVGNGWARRFGGGIANGGGTLTLVHDTFSGNIRGAIQTDQGAETIVGNTIIGAGFADGTDFACLPSGRWTDEFSDNGPSAQAITNDDGNNFDQDGHCGFDGNGDIADADPRLASIADNGGPTRTQALLAGSQAIGNGNEPNARQPISATSPATARATSARSRPTPRPCPRPRAPARPATSPTRALTFTGRSTSPATPVDSTSSGACRRTTCSTRRPSRAPGVVDSDTFETQTLGGLNPGTQYFYKIVADNSSGSTPDTASDIKSFTTQADPPSVFSVNADSVTDTTANLSFTINPNGADTSYVIQYGDADPGQDKTTDPVDIGADAGDQQLTATLQNLDPNSDYHFEVIATNSVDTTTQSGQDFTTDQQIGGIQRLPIELDDSGTSNFGCPQTARIDWGDNSGVQHVVPDCLFPGDEEDPAQYSLTADHTYAQTGHYEIQITYTDIEQTSTQFAQIAENDVQPPANNTLPAISGTTTPGHTLTTTDGDWSGDPAFDYQWQDCDQNGDNCTDVGDDQNTYALTNGDVGNTIRVIVTASNDGGSTPATSDPTAVVAGPPPSNNGLPAISGTPSPGNSLTCSDGSWSNNPTGFAFAWSRDGSPISGPAAQTYAVQAADQGHTLTCTVIAHNDGGSSSPATSAGVAVPSGSTGGSGSKPTTNKPSTSATKPTGTAFDGSINPGGLATTAHFEYGLDSKYTDPGTSGPVYDLSTPPQNVGSGSSSQTVSASVSGLVPNALYHVRLVATNSAGTTFGPDATFTTPPAPAPGAPTVSKSFDVKPTQGVVLILVNGKLVPLTQLKQIPAGAVIDALHGTLNLVTSTGKGHTTQTGTFAGAIFKVTQDRSGLTTLTLVENAFKGAPSYASCNVARGKASAAALSAKTLQLLKGKDNHGKFRTKGRYAAATTRGTAWSVADRCDGTLTKVTQSSVLVNDFVRHVSLILHAGHSYLALAKPPRHK